MSKVFNTFCKPDVKPKNSMIPVDHADFSLTMKRTICNSNNVVSAKRTLSTKHTSCKIRLLSTGVNNENAYMVQRKRFEKDISILPEALALGRLIDFLEQKAAGVISQEFKAIKPPIPPSSGYISEMNTAQIRTTIDAMLATFLLHVESRIASLIGKGFYTIGPCGEEALSSAGLTLKPADSLALHYRHVGVNIARQLNSGQSLEKIMIDRARGYTVSQLDPVTGGVHCSIGSGAPEPGLPPGSGDFIVTSTLASQCTSAVGRALAYSLACNSVSDRRISLVTVGDGSVHNHHFWSAIHLSRHARHLQVKCPAVFGVSDNGLSISYKTRGYVDTLFNNDPLVHLLRVNGSDMMDVYSQTLEAVNFARKMSRPVVLLYKNITRRFGHAATDRQNAYLQDDEITMMRDSTVLEDAIMQAVDAYAATSYSEVLQRLKCIRDWTLLAFQNAASEGKVNREEMLRRVARPEIVAASKKLSRNSGGGPDTVPRSREVMRKHMTRVIGEVMESDDSVVYMGEDVRHGGYYVVTEGLAKQFPTRVLDFPPDETSLLGAAVGFAQTGLTPIVEIPYAKYLDCGADLFYEAAISNWLSNGQRPNGMIIRLQGFDRGVFGGNFHTSNTLQHIPPGIDVFCFSNGEDYARGFRLAIQLAKEGRVVVSVDCTDLLNLRHIHDKDRAWERAYPNADENGCLNPDEVGIYGGNGSLAVVTYGNGVVTALRARKLMQEIGVSEDDLDIIDCRCLSAVPRDLSDVVRHYKAVLFADICKDGPGGSVLSSFGATLHANHSLESRWSYVAAPRTYNPLGNTCTFLNETDIRDGFKGILD